MTAPDPAALCMHDPVEEPCPDGCVCPCADCGQLRAYQAGRAEERRRIADLASSMHATIPADHPEGARASFADYLRTYAATDRLAAYQAASNDIHDITDGPGQLAWAAFYWAWMDGVQAVQDQARAEGALAERRRIRDASTRTGFEHQGRWYEQYHVPAALLDGDGDV